MSFSTRLRELRLHFGLTQKQLAQLVGVTKGSISQWEVGLVNPRNIKAENMEKLCKVLQKPVGYLLDGKQSSASVKDNTASYDAGYDAFLTGFAFISMAVKATTTLDFKKMKEFDTLGVCSGIMQKLVKIDYHYKIFMNSFVFDLKNPNEDASRREGIEKTTVKVNLVGIEGAKQKK